MSRHALLAGASGLIGRHLLRRLLAEPRYERISVLVRRPLTDPGLAAQPRLSQIVGDLDDLDALGDALRADDVFCCLGTTRAKAGSREAFEQVDYELVLQLARAARKAGSRQFLLVSAVGANPDALAFYSRVKGRAECDLRRVGYASLHILRPSLLLGSRDESRPLEAIAQRVAPYLNRMLARRLQHYRAVPADTVAAALLKAALADRPGVHVHEAPFEV